MTAIPRERRFLAFHRSAGPSEYYALSYTGAVNMYDSTGAYSVRKGADGWVLTARSGQTSREVADTPARPLGTFRTLAEAKRAAQADYFVPASAADYTR